MAFRTSALDSPSRGEGVRLAVGILVVRGGRVLLGRRRGSHGAGTWSAPGGRMEFGETVVDCARRELLEETGLYLRSAELGPFTNDIFHEAGQHYFTAMVIARDAEGEPENREPDKCEGWGWHDWQALPKPLFLPLQNLLLQGFVLPT